MKLLTLVGLAFGILIPTLAVSAEAEKSWWESAKEQAAKAWEDSGPAMERAAQQAREQTAAALDSAKRKAEEAWRATEADRQRAMQAAQDAAAEAQRKSAEMAASAAQKIQAAWKNGESDRANVAQAAKDAGDRAAQAIAKKSEDAWNSTGEQRTKMWNGTKREAKAAGESTERFYNEHQEEINTGAVATAGLVAWWLSGGREDVESFFNTQQTQGPYSNVPEPSTVGPGKDFSTSQREAIFRANMERNGGVLRSDLSGKELERAGAYVKGYTPSPNEAQVDHVQPKSTGGPNSSSNAQVLSREENLSKGATPP